MFGSLPAAPLNGTGKALIYLTHQTPPLSRKDMKMNQSPHNDTKLLLDSTRAIIHMANKISTAKRDIAAIAEDDGFNARGLRAMVEDNQRILGGLADILDGMDAVSEEEDWVGEIMKDVARRCQEGYGTQNDDQLEP